jgi:hypothetical protein
LCKETIEPREEPMATSNDTAEKESDDTPAENQTDGDTG